MSLPATASMSVLTLTGYMVLLLPASKAICRSGDIDWRSPEGKTSDEGASVNRPPAVRSRFPCASDPATLSSPSPTLVASPPLCSPCQPRGNGHGGARSRPRRPELLFLFELPGRVAVGKLLDLFRALRPLSGCFVTVGHWQGRRGDRAWECRLRDSSSSAEISSSLSVGHA